MIAFDLSCKNQHVFEAWFENSKAFEEQCHKGLIECPICGDKNIKKHPSQFAVLRRGKETKPSEGPGGGMEAVVSILDKVQRYVIENTEDVGDRFTETALKMHYGVIKPRNIRGVATQEQEKTLKNEGIDFCKIPVVKNHRRGT